SKRSGRTVRMPRRFVDYLPGSATHLAHMPPTNRQQRGRDPPEQADQSDRDQPPPPSPGPTSDPEDTAPALIPFQTEPDAMGLYRVYPMRPTLAPEANVTLQGVTDAPTLDGERVTPIAHPGLPSPEISSDQLFEAFTNPSAGILMAWQLEDLNGLNHTRELKLLDEYLKNKSNPFQEEYGWRQSTVKIRLPKEKVKFASEADAPELEIPGVHHRCLTDLITHVFENEVSKTFNMTPFQQFWKTPDNRDIKVFGESYASPAMLEAYTEINALPRAPGDELERAVASVMVWSDATHLANFGDASLWPFYVYFGNQSKYTRGKPTARACHHLAYIPTLPKNLQDIYVDIFGEATTADVHTHLKRELMHAIWGLILDGKFMEAYEHGIVIWCSDGITQRVFPRFFSYSADYPEK
ncbi:hypothetical protein DEU56DRAFT_749192, partial [Suillus clintonianus]|uniref:uncharacterized protein n=1 Tax=Suillus clintonianus TaxID=1904413 RepID=UPI001B86F2E1